MKKNLLLTIFSVSLLGFTSLAFATSSPESYMTTTFVSEGNSKAKLTPSSYIFVNIDRKFQKINTKICSKNTATGEITKITCSGWLAKRPRPSGSVQTLTCRFSGESEEELLLAHFWINSYKHVLGDFYDVDIVVGNYGGERLLLKKSNKAVPLDSVGCKKLFEDPKAYKGIRKIEKRLKTILKESNENYSNIR